MASLNPAMRIGQQLIEVPMIHEGIGEKDAYARALETVTDVKLPDPERILKAYPHQFSGGMRQRVVPTSFGGISEAAPCTPLPKEGDDVIAPIRLVPRAPARGPGVKTARPTKVLL